MTDKDMLLKMIGDSIRDGGYTGNQCPLCGSKMQATGGIEVDGANTQTELCSNWPGCKNAFYSK